MRAWMRAGKRQASATAGTSGGLGHGWLRLILVLLVVGPVAAQQPYYYAGGQRYTLIPSDTFVGVEADSPADAVALPGRVGAQGLQVDTAHSSISSKSPIAILAVPGGMALGGGTNAATIAGVTGVRQVLPTYGRAGYVLVATADLVTNFSHALSAAERAALAARYGIQFVAPLGNYAPFGYLCRIASGDANVTVGVAAAIHENEQVTFSAPNFAGRVEVRGVRQAASRLTPNDTLFPDQWHLNSTGQNGALPDTDVNGPEAWNISIGSRNITICVIDTGIEFRHPDLTAPGKAVQGFDADDNDNDPSPNGAGEEHGTAVCGVATAAQNNGLGVSGIAPECRLMPIRLIAAGFTDQGAANAFTFAADNGADVISNSWGPVDGLGIPQPMPDIIRAGLDYAADQGRGGLGCVVLFAAGNGNESTDLDGFASYPKVINVGACNDQGVRSFYSDFGATLDVSAPSNGGVTTGITTTDQVGGNGYAGGDYTNDFGGTSSACPLAAGVAALVLSVDPQLTRVELQNLLQSTAQKIDPAGGNYDANGHSDLYGFGKVDAFAACSAAESGLGVPVTFSVSTINGTTGGKPTDATNPVAVTYTLRNRVRQVAVWDGSPVTVNADPGSLVAFPNLSNGSGTAQRWIINQPSSRWCRAAPLRWPRRTP
ncbi:MAG: S8 family serine peptidase [Armatimonadetes bacterium]|nr:S8 family serine peptidase [Armatimonadota bacterium]